MEIQSLAHLGSEGLSKLHEYMAQSAIISITGGPVFFRVCTYGPIEVLKSQLIKAEKTQV